MPPNSESLRMAVSASRGAAQVLYPSQFQSCTSTLVDRPAACRAGNRSVAVKKSSPLVFHCVEGYPAQHVGSFCGDTKSTCTPCAWYAWMYLTKYWAYSA